MKPKTPFNDTFQSWAVYAAAVLSAVGLISWAHQHVRETGHPVHLTIGYDVRDENWMTRLSSERHAEIKDLVEDPQAARALTEQILRDAKGETTN
ncbi:MAG TPA: hypothetical protein VN157_04405 [Caulobacter sp.]|nr:hypothetical protein [Caulobacter sp.]